MRLNVQPKLAPIYTHEGAKASHITPYQQLRRSVLSCMLWEDTFYESGESIAKRISENARIVSPYELANLAIEARQSFHLRHVPLLLLLELAKTGRGIPGLTRNTVEAVISRADEMAELLAIYWKDGKKPVPHGILKGLRQASLKFDTFQLNKWNRDGAVKYRDVVFTAHINFPDDERSKYTANAVNRSFFPEATKGGYRVAESFNFESGPHTDTPYTWEALIAAAGSNRAQRKDIWESLLKGAINRERGGIGYMALLRNLRNFTEDGVNHQLVESAIEARVGARNILPFRFVQAAKVAPQFFRALDRALQANVPNQGFMPGTTALVIDCSGSMTSPLHAKTQVSRLDAAAALAGCVNGNVRLIAFGQDAKEIKPIPGLGCEVALKHSGVGHATNAHLGVLLANNLKPTPDRIVVISDEQVTQQLPKPIARHGYVINVGSYQNGIGYGDWTKIDGFSASIFDYIRENESPDDWYMEAA